MAKLPTAADVIGRVQPQSAPRINVPRDAFPDYSGITSDLTAQLDTFINEQKKQNDETEAQDLSNQFNTRARTLTLGNDKDPNDPDYEPGYKSLLGKNAMDRRADYEKRLEDFRKELIGKASNDTVRRRLRTTFDRRTAQFQTATGTHFNAQRKTYRKTTFEATNAEATESAIADPTDPSHIDDVYNNTFKYYSDQGVGAKAAQSLAEEARSKANASVIVALSETDPQAAKKYMEEQAQAGRIDLDVLAATRKEVKTAILRSDSNRNANDIFAKLPGPENAAKRYELARTSIPNVEERDATVKRLRARDHEIKIAQDISRKAAYERALIGVGQGQNPQDMNLSGLTPTEQNNIKKAAQARIDGDAGFGKIDQPAAQNSILSAMSSNEEFRVFPLENYKSQLTRETYDKYFKHRSGLLAKDEVAVASGTIYRLANSEADKNVDKMKLKGPQATALKGALKGSLKDFVDEYREENQGRYPNRELIKRHIAKQTLTVNFDYRMQKDEMRVFAEDRGIPFSIEDYDEPLVQEQISEATGYRPEDVAKIISALEKVRRPITIDNITAVYELSRRNALNEDEE